MITNEQKAAIRKALQGTKINKVAIATLYFNQQGSNKFTSANIDGAAALYKKSDGYYIGIVDIERRNGIVWEQRLDKDMQYEIRAPLFHSFRAGATRPNVQYVGLSFRYEKDAHGLYKKTVEKSRSQASQSKRGSTSQSLIENTNSTPLDFKYAGHTSHEEPICISKQLKESGISEEELRLKSGFMKELSLLTKTGGLVSKVAHSQCKNPPLTHRTDTSSSSAVPLPPRVASSSITDPPSRKTVNLTPSKAALSFRNDFPSPKSVPLPQSGPDATSVVPSSPSVKAETFLSKRTGTTSSTEQSFSTKMASPPMAKPPQRLIPPPPRMVFKPDEFANQKTQTMPSTTEKTTHSVFTADRLVPATDGTTTPSLATKPTPFQPKSRTPPSIPKKPDQLRRLNVMPALHVDERSSLSPSLPNLPSTSPSEPRGQKQDIISESVSATLKPVTTLASFPPPSSFIAIQSETPRYLSTEAQLSPSPPPRTTLPPPPPPPPPPSAMEQSVPVQLQTPIANNDSRANLMASIRATGGFGQLKEVGTLKSADQVDAVDTPSECSGSMNMVESLAALLKDRRGAIQSDDESDDDSDEEW